MGLVYSEPACQSAYDGDLRRLYLLLRDDPRNLNVQEEDNGDTPLIAACRHGNVHVVRYLLDNGADAHLTNKKQRTCLHYASRRTLSVVDYLMIAVLLPILLLGYFLLVTANQTPACVASDCCPVCSWSSFTPVGCEGLSGPDVWGASSAPADIIPTSLLLKPCDTVGPSVVKLVNLWLESGSVLSYFKQLQRQRQNTALMEALLSAGADVDAIDYKGNTALHYLCQRKNHRLVPLLLHRNASAHVHNNDGETPLDIASRLKFKKIVHMLTKSQ